MGELASRGVSSPDNSNISQNIKDVKTNDIKFSLKMPLDNKKYSEAVKDGDEETAQQYVDSAAMKWGAYSVDCETPLKLYHGTQSFGFTEFDLDRMDDKRSIFLTSDINTAGSYSGNIRQLNVSDNSGNNENMSVDKAINILNNNSKQLYGSKYYKYGYAENNETIKNTNDGIDKLKQSPGMKWAKEHHDDFKNAYIGTSSQNTKMLILLKHGKLLRP